MHVQRTYVKPALDVTNLSRNENRKLFRKIPASLYVENQTDNNTRKTVIIIYHYV